MKKGWQTKALGDVCDFEGGSQPPKSQFIYEEKRGYVRFLQIRDFGSDKNITYIPLAKKNRLCDENDILIGRYGASVGKILTGKSGAYNVALMKTLPNLSALNRSWFYNYLLSDEFQLRLLNVADRSAQAGFSKDDIYNFPVPLLPLPEQHRIVGILDAAFEGLATAKANAEKNLLNARALFDSHLQAVFSQRGKWWVERKLGDLSKINYGYTESACAEPVGPKFLRITDIQDNRVDWNTVPYCPIASSDLPKYKLAEGDIVFARTGATTGKSYIITDPPSAVFASYLIRVQLATKELLPPFLFLFFQTASYWESIKAGSSGSAQGGFNATKLGELVIPYPTVVNEQQIIIAKLNDISAETQRLAAIYQKKLAALEALKKSLLHQAFTGEL